MISCNGEFRDKWDYHVPKERIKECRVWAIECIRNAGVDMAKEDLEDWVLQCELAAKRLYGKYVKGKMYCADWTGFSCDMDGFIYYERD